jgi:hypothetical protein
MAGSANDPSRPGMQRLLMAQCGFHGNHRIKQFVMKAKMEALTNHFVG